MEIRSKLAKIKNKANNIEDYDEIEQVIELENIELEVYVRQGYLVFEIPDTNGNPHSSDIKEVEKTVIEVFGVTMLPNPDTGSVRGSIAIQE